VAEEALAPLSTARKAAGFGRRISIACLALFLSCAALAAPPKKNPSWAELTPEQQQTLAPLAGEWNTLDASRRSKWIGIAKRYPGMTETERQRVQTRMADWIKLTPDQRRDAREQYRKIGKLPPGKRDVVSQQWEEYQQLPEAEKKNLAVESKKKNDKIEPRSRAKSAQAKQPPGAPAPQAPAPALSTSIPTSAN
jgi:hypothetical protein